MMAISYLNTNYPVEIGFPSFLNTDMHTESVGKDKVTDNMCTVHEHCIVYTVCIRIYSSVFSKASVDP